MIEGTILQLDVRTLQTDTLTLGASTCRKLRTVAELRKNLSDSDNLPHALVVRCRGDNESVIKLFMELREKRPSIVRVVLMTEVSTRFQNRLHDLAHYVCPIGIVTDTVAHMIEQGIATQYELSRQVVRDFGRQAGEWIKLPRIYQDVDGMIRSNRAIDYTLLTSMYRQDPATFGSLIQFLNSKEYGWGVASFKPEEAIQRIGARTLRDITLHLCCEKELSQPNEWSLIDFAELEKRARMTAKLAELYAKDANLDRAHQQHAFLAGLMSYVGLRFLIRQDIERVNDCMETAQMMKRSMRSAIKLEYSLNVSEISAAMLEYWQLSPRVIKAILYYRKPQMAGDRSFVAMEAVHLADAMLPPLKMKNGIRITGELSDGYLSDIDMLHKKSHWQRMANEYLQQCHY